MQFTGKNLTLVRRALDLALDEIHNQSATCPDVAEYEDDLDDLEREAADIRKLIARIDSATTTLVA